MRVIYDGPINRVELALPGDRNRTVVARGDAIDVPPEVGESLLRQSTWRKAPTRKPPTPPSPTVVVDEPAPMAREADTSEKEA